MHEGEIVLPAPDAEAEIDLLRSDLGADIHITLPVIVEIGSTEPDDERTNVIVDEILRRLRAAIEAQSTA